MGGNTSDDNDTDSNKSSINEQTVTQCCKICSTGKACGDSCISKSYSCSKGSGCAYNGKLDYKLLPGIPVVSIGQISSFTGYSFSSGSEAVSVDEAGTFTYELNVDATFTSSYGEKIIIEQPDNFEVIE